MDIPLIWIAVYVLIGVAYNFVDLHTSDEMIFADRFTKLMIACTICLGWPFHLALWVRYALYNYFSDDS